MDRTTAYAKKVVAGKRRVGRKEYLACKRHLEDLKRKKNFPYYFDDEQAEFAITFANTLVMKDGTPLKTREFQNFIIGNLFGWRRKETKERRFREAYIQIGRQNGKSFLCGIVATFFALCMGIKERIFFAATKQDQANIVWEEVANFIEVDPKLNELFKVRKHNREIECLYSGTIMKSIGRDTKSMDGFRNILNINDELHAHPNDQMYKLLLDGQPNVKNALTLAITTAGFNLNSFCYEQYLFCEQILERTVEKESIFIFICELDEDDDVFEPMNWLKANPYQLYKSDDEIDTEKLEIMKQKSIDAKIKGGKELDNFLTKQLNRWVAIGENGYINLKKFKKCESDIDLKDLKGKKAFLGIDLSSGGDLTSIALVIPLEDDKVYIHSHSFMPEKRLEEHKKSDDVPYHIWVKNGLLTLTSGMYGMKTDYKYIINYIKEIRDKYKLNILEVGYDSHNAGVFLNDLDFLGVPLTEVKQSAKALNDATQDFKFSVDAMQVKYNKNNALLRWSIANAVTTSNSFGEIKIDKATRKNRIDPVDAIIDAWKIYMLYKNTFVDINESVADWLKIMS